MSALQPPRLNTEEASEAREVSDASDEHYSSASEGAHSPIPITRVERVDSSPAHGEIPGTPAYDQRVQDAVPDEIEIVPDAQAATAGRSRSNTQRERSPSQVSRPGTPGGSPIPKTVVEKVDFVPSHGEVEGTPAKEMRMADAMPDEIRRAPEEARVRLEGRDAQDGREVAEDEDEDEEDGERRQAWFRRMWEGNGPLSPRSVDDRRQGNDNEEEDEEEEDGFGDDFDDFAEGEEHEDFGDFDEAAEEDDEDVPPPSREPPPSLPPAPDILAGLPPLKFPTNPTTEDIRVAIQPYLTAIYPSTQTPDQSSLPPLDASQTPAFQTPRALSLWQQLVSPPPMQPPNWTRSRIRRLFLVSLGVPVDLDEILPPSKQKRLVLPSIGLEGPQRPGGAVERLQQGEGNDSSTSLDSKTGRPKKTPQQKGRLGKGGVPPPPDFDLNAATLICRTTDEALFGFNDEELKGHVVVLEGMNGDASKVLEYWLVRRDEGVKEKEALEGVIENLVGFVKGRRQGGGK